MSMWAWIGVVGSVLCVIACASAASVPHFDSQYKAQVLVSLPYDGILEPMTVWFDGVNNKQRVEYYSGLDTYITDVAKQVYWQVNPVYSTYHCFETDGPVSLTSILPDLTKFTSKGSVLCPSDTRQKCDKFSYVYSVGSKVNTYSFYSFSGTQTPAVYHFIGYDNLLGSHYDEYQFTYQFFSGGPSAVANSSLFSKPNMNCTAFGPTGGPSRMVINPMQEIEMLMPPADPAATPAHGHYSHFQEMYGKSCSDAAECDSRRHSFVRNVRFINSKNRQLRSDPKTSLRLAINHIADFSEGERNAYAGVSTRPRPANTGAASVHPEPEDRSGLPMFIDWRQHNAVTPVKDQGICGSCWSFGTAQVIEGAAAIKTGKLQEMSQQAIMDCTWDLGNFACDGGEDFLAYQSLMKNFGGGLATASEYGPYLMQDGMCHLDKVPKAATVTSYVNVTSGSQSALQSALNLGPVSVSIDANVQSFLFYSEGVYSDPACKSDLDDLDHTVLAVGYGVSEQGEPYWIVKNSWSVHWGNAGYVLISSDNNTCGVATAATYPILA